MKKKLFVILGAGMFIFVLSKVSFAGPPLEILLGRRNVAPRVEFSGKVETTRIVEVKASKFNFSPDPIMVKKGERVRLVVTSTDVDHGLAIDEFKVNLSIPASKTETVEFVADKKGTFRVYCDLWQGQMQSSLIVK